MNKLIKCYLKKKMRINIKPFSANNMWQGKKYKTANYKAWREEFGQCLLEARKNYVKKTHDGPVDIKMKVHLKNANLSDVDNFIKPIFDALVEHGILKDDRLVQMVQVSKNKSEEEYISIQINQHAK